MADVISQYTRKPARYGYLDGVVDLGMGVMFLMFALVARLLQAATVLGQWLTICGIFALIALGAFGLRYIRRRLVYPRSGYLEFRMRPWVPVLTVAISGVIGVAVNWFVVKAHNHRLSPPLIYGVIFGLLMLIGALSRGLPRLAVLGVLSMAIGFALHFLEPARLPSAVWYCLAMGRAFILSGALTLCLFVRRMPPRNLEAE